MKKPLKILLTGASGQVGNKLLQALRPYGNVIATVSPRQQVHDDDGFLTLDLADLAAIAHLVRGIKPDLIINPAAYTAVDKAEGDEKLAFRINAEAPAILAQEAQQCGAMLVHFSTDYVYPGLGQAPQSEAAPTGPLNAYGRTKLAGEQAIQQTLTSGGYIILRTSWVFSDHGSNFVKTMLRLGAEREILRVVADQHGAPTSAAFLARMVAHIIKSAQSHGLLKEAFAKFTGVYNLCCMGETTWHGFAEEIFRQAKDLNFPLQVRTVEPIPTEGFPTPAKRPKNSRMNCEKFRSQFAVAALQPWQDALRETLTILAP